MQNNDDNKNQNKPGFNLGSNKTVMVVLAAVAILFLIYIFLENSVPKTEISYREFRSEVISGQIEWVKITNNVSLEGQFKNGEWFKSRIAYLDEPLLAMLDQYGVDYAGSPEPTSPLAFILNTVPFLIIILLVWFMFRQVQGGGGNKAFSFGKSKAKRYLETSDKITFADVAGLKEAKYEVEEVVDFLKNPMKFAKIGARIPKGILLVGSPGTGKTLLAKAIAGEAGVAFFHMSGSDFVEMFVGVGASRVRDLFEQGRKNAPCIIFIDELDAVGRTRGAGYGGGHDEREQTLNQMLVEMDGFDTKDGVILISATNRPDVLDPALLRPGRFDRQVVVDMPDQKERAAILGIHCKKIPVGPDVDLTIVAKATPGTSGADLANMVNEAALYAARKNSNIVKMEHFEEARDKLLLGVARKSKVVTPEDKLATAYHEGGHALLHYYLDNSDPLHKVTVIPHGLAGGLALSLPEKDYMYYTKGWLLDRIKIAMGGYVAEYLIYGETTSGTSNDIKQATNIARKMVCEFGMSDLGFVSLGTGDEPIFIGKEIATHKDYSDDTAKQIDDEMRKIMDECQAATEKILKTNIGQLKTLAKELVEKETLDDTDIRKLFNFPEKKKTVLA